MAATDQSRMDILTDVETLQIDLASLTAAVEELEEEIVEERALALEAIEKHEDAERELKAREEELEEARKEIEELEVQATARDAEAWDLLDKLREAVEDFLVDSGHPRRPMRVDDRALQALVNAAFD